MARRFRRALARRWRRRQQLRADLIGGAMVLAEVSILVFLIWAQT